MSAERTRPQVSQKILLERVRQEARKSAAENPQRHLRVKVTMNFDGDIIQHFKTRAADEGRSYQVLMNDALRDAIRGSRDEQVARRVQQLLLEDKNFLSRLTQTLQFQTGQEEE